eukprot:TRINITY_DN22292_c0_g3_i1.p2 TRINITY_DN22292_c0_g3~~TRINITY_DN22292_c0_g3_i1.p2  ORF type:complete len:121 (-),score=3.33 TRINITY_DN22292_c0_g3_i1:106-468(-)
MVFRGFLDRIFTFKCSPPCTVSGQLRFTPTPFCTRLKRGWCETVIFIVTGFQNIKEVEFFFWSASISLGLFLRRNISGRFIQVFQSAKIQILRFKQNIYTTSFIDGFFTQDLSKGYFFQR